MGPRIGRIDASMGTGSKWAHRRATAKDRRQPPMSARPQMGTAAKQAEMGARQVGVRRRAGLCWGQAITLASAGRPVANGDLR